MDCEVIEPADELTDCAEVALSSIAFVSLVESLIAVLMCSTDERNKKSHTEMRPRMAFVGLRWIHGRLITPPRRLYAVIELVC